MVFKLLHNYIKTAWIYRKMNSFYVYNVYSLWNRAWETGRQTSSPPQTFLPTVLWTVQFLCRQTRCTAESPFGKHKTHLSPELCVNSCYNVELLVAFICKRVLINNFISRMFYWFLPYHRIDKNSFQLMLWGRNIVTWIGERKLWHWAWTSSMHQCRTIPTPPILSTGVSVLCFTKRNSLLLKLVARWITLN